MPQACDDHLSFVRGLSPVSTEIRRRQQPIIEYVAVGECGLPVRSRAETVASLGNRIQSTVAAGRLDAVLLRT
jgi:hypothetical protein